MVPFGGTNRTPLVAGMKSKFVLWLIPLLFATEVAAADVRDSLVAIWEGQRSPIATGRFQFRSIRTGKPYVANLSRDKRTGS